jgi:hypothetical protein
MDFKILLSLLWSKGIPSTSTQYRRQVGELSTIRHGSRKPGSEMVENHEEALDVRFRRQVIDEHPE